MVHALILTHGALGRVLMQSVETVLGPQASVEVLSNEDRSLEQLIEEADRCVGGEPTVLFVDFYGGSTYMAGRTSYEHHPGCALICGVNLPMLLSFFTKREKLPFKELVEVVASDGHRGIQIIP